eukprot:888964-Prorocentrum_minimum.AAC.1
MVVTNGDDGRTGAWWISLRTAALFRRFLGGYDCASGVRERRGLPRTPRTSRRSEAKSTRTVVT